MKDDATPSNSIKPIFLAALRLTDPEARSAYLERACGEDLQSRRKVEDLLDARDQASNPLDKAVERFQPAQTAATAGMADEESIDVSSHPMIGPYKVLEELGAGGMGTVFMAQQTEPIKRKVALKIIKPGMDSQQVIARFEAERQALALMDHPNIARVLDAGATDQGRPFFVMELVRGVPLTEYCKNEKLSTDDRLRLFMDICQGVQHAHQKGVIHRDLKPSNVMVTLHDGTPLVKIIDFGIAKAIDQSLTERTLFTQYAQLVGTPLYMSPEQAELSGLDVDTRSDVYSLGVLLYELLTGTTPFDPETLRDLGLDEVRRMIRETEPPRPSHRVSTLKAEEVSTLTGKTKSDGRQLQLVLRGELDWIVMKALEKKRNRRYESSMALCRDIQRYLNDQPVQACPPSAAYRLQKLARRHRVALITTALVMAALLAGMAGSLWQAWEAIDARRLAEQRLETARIAQQHAERERAVADSERRRSRMLLYVSDMKLASDALQVGDVPRVVTLLDRHQPSEGEQDLRDFVWHYLRMSVTIQKKWKLDLESSVWGMDLSPDGQTLAVATQNGQIRVLQASSGELLQTYIAMAKINAVAWDPLGRHIASAGSDGYIRVWEFAPAASADQTSDDRPQSKPLGGAVVAQTTPALSFAAHDGEAFSVCFTPDGETIVSGGYDGTIRTWDAATENALAVLVGDKNPVEQLDISPNGELLASATSGETYGTVDVWDLENGSRIKTHVSPSAWHMKCVAFSPDGSYIAAGDEDGNLLVADVDSGMTASVEQMDGIESVAFLGDSKRVVTGDRGGAIHIRSVSRDQDGSLRLATCASSQWTAHQGRVQTLATLPGTHAIFSGSRDTGITNWSSHPESTQWTCSVNQDFTIGNDGSVFACEHEVCQFELKTRRMVAAMMPCSHAWILITAAEASPRIAVADTYGMIAVYDHQQRREIARWSMEHEPHDIAISPDGRQVVVTWFDRQDHVKLFDVTSPSIPRHIAARQCRCIVFSPDGRLLGVGEMDDLLIHDLVDGGPPRRLASHDQGLTDAAFSPDGRIVATVSDDRCLKLWDVASGQEIQLIEAHRQNVLSVDFSHDGRMLATGGVDNMVRLWHAETLQPLVEIITEDSAKKVRFADQDRRLVVRVLDYAMVIDGAATPVPAIQPLEGAHLMGLGRLPNIRSYWPTDVSDDGRVIVGDFKNPTGRSFRWTHDSGIVALPLPESYRRSYAKDVDPEGQVIMGRFRTPTGTMHLGKWLPGDSLPVIEPLTGDWQAVYASAMDGASIAGDARRGDSQMRRAFLFDGTQFTELRGISGEFHTAARSVARHGSLLTGMAWKGDKTAQNIKTHTLRIVRWRDGQADFLPGFGEEAYKWYLTDTSADGSIVVGRRWPVGTVPSDRLGLSFRWVDGRVEMLGELPGGLMQSWAEGISADGRVVVGQSETVIGRTAFVWDGAHGMRSLTNVLQQYGADVAGWQLYTATVASADGTHIAGRGINPQGHREAFLAQLPREAFDDQ